MKLDFKKLTHEQYLIPLKIVFVYIVWKVFHHFATVPGTPLNIFWLKLVFKIGSVYAWITSVILTFFGMEATSDGININLIAAYKQIWVQDHCLAIPAMIVFTGSVLFFKGTASEKAKFLLIGLTGIVIINLLRLIFVCVAFVYLTTFLFQINHSILYVMITYGFIFYMVARWMNRTIKKASDQV